MTERQNQSFLTQESIRRAFLEELEANNITRIKIIDLCERARVSKSTFYRYYRDAYDLLIDCFRNYMPTAHNDIDLSSKEKSLSYCAQSYDQVKEMPALWLACMECTYPPFQKEFRDWAIQGSREAIMLSFRERNLNDDNSYVRLDLLSLILQNTLNLLQQNWLKTGCKETSQQMAELTMLIMDKFTDSMKKA